MNSNPFKDTIMTTNVSSQANFNWATLTPSYDFSQAEMSNSHLQSNDDWNSRPLAIGFEKEMDAYRTEAYFVSLDYGLEGQNADDKIEVVALLLKARDLLRISAHDAPLCDPDSYDALIENLNELAYFTNEQYASLSHYLYEPGFVSLLDDSLTFSSDQRAVSFILCSKARQLYSAVIDLVSYKMTEEELHALKQAKLV